MDHYAPRSRLVRSWWTQVWGAGGRERQTCLFVLPLRGFTMQTVPGGDERPTQNFSSSVEAGSTKLGDHEAATSQPGASVRSCAPSQGGRARAPCSPPPGFQGCSWAEIRASFFSTEMRKNPRVKLQLAGRLTASLSRDALLKSVTLTVQARKSWEGRTVLGT